MWAQNSGLSSEQGSGPKGGMGVKKKDIFRIDQWCVKKACREGSRAGKPVCLNQRCLARMVGTGGKTGSGQEKSGKDSVLAMGGDGIL